MPEVDDTQKQLMALIVKYAVDVNTTITDKRIPTLQRAGVCQALERHQRCVESDEIPPKKQSVPLLASGSSTPIPSSVKKSIQLSDYADGKMYVGVINVADQKAHETANKPSETALGHKPAGKVVDGRQTHTDAALEVLDCSD